MKTPTPKPFVLRELPELARLAMRTAKFPMLATVDGDQPRLRPVSPLRVDGFTHYLANFRSYHKTDEIAANPRVELCYLSPDHDQVRISGVARVLEDEALLTSLWVDNPLLSRYFRDFRDPDLIIYRIEPERVRFMREWALDYHDVPLNRAAMTA